MPTKQVKPALVQRIEIELSTLNARLTYLERFTATKDFLALSDEHRFLISVQCSAMALYFQALRRRAELLGADISGVQR